MLQPLLTVLLPLPTLDQFTPLDPLFPEIEWIGVGDVVVVHGKNEDMLGIVKDTDPAEGKALVRSWSREVGVWYTYWWKLEVIELAATAGTTAA